MAAFEAAIQRGGGPRSGWRDETVPAGVVAPVPGQIQVAGTAAWLCAR